MFDVNVLVTYMVTVVTFLILPGPVNLVIVNASIQSGIKAAFWSIVGTNLASLVLIAIAGLMITGVGFVNVKFLDILTIFGGFYLMYYAYQLWRSAVLVQNLNDISVPNAKNPAVALYSKSVFIRNGFFVGISNPKDVVFFVSFFPPFISNLGMGVLNSLVILTIIWCVLDYSLLMAYGLGAKKLITPRVEKIVLFVCAFIFFVLGLYAVINSVFNF